MFSYFVFKMYTIDEIIDIFENDNYEINKLDINRIYRFLDTIVELN